MDDEARERTTRWYRSFGEHETPGRSALYSEWALGVADDPEILGLLDGLPLPKRQPNLLFGAARMAGSPLTPYAEWRAWLREHWAAVEPEIRSRWTQTNETARCAALLPALALIDRPIALLEVGASAGLCLLLDRYSYLWRTEVGERRLDPASGASALLLESDVTGPFRAPERMPRIVWRAGLDREPLDVASGDDVRWLDTLIWPEEQPRRERLAAAVAIARRDPPELVRGDAVEALGALAARARAEAPDATLVVLSSAAIVYLAPEPRARFLAEVGRIGARLVSLEGRGILPPVAAALPDAVREKAEFVLGLDDRPLAVVDPHGLWATWLGNDESTDGVA